MEGPALTSGASSTNLSGGRFWLLHQIADYPLKNNYNGSTRDRGYISRWKLTLDGLASGLSISLDIRNLLNRFSVHVRAYPLCRKRNGRVWSLRSISMPRAILTFTLCRSTWRRPAIHRRCLPHTSRSAPYRGSWSAAPSVGARETWFEECEGRYHDYVSHGRATRLLGRTWIFPLLRNLTPFNISIKWRGRKQPHTSDWTVTRVLRRITYLSRLAD
jgi:hypothetical protein